MEHQNDLIPLIMGIIANKTSDDSPWTSMKAIKAALLKYRFVTTDYLDTHLSSVIKDMIKSQAIVMKSAGIYGIASHLTMKPVSSDNSPKKRHRKTSQYTEEKQDDKKLGKEVTITHSGRVSIKRKH